MDRHNLRPAGLPVGVDRGAGHRARPVQRDHRGDVAELVGPHGPQQPAHRTAVELEHAQRVAAGQQVVGRLVVEAERFQIDLDAPVVLDAPDRVVDHGEVAQPEEVHLQQADVLARGVVELRDHGAVGLALPDRDVIE